MSNTKTSCTCSVCKRQMIFSMAQTVRCNFCRATFKIEANYEQQQSRHGNSSVRKKSPASGSGTANTINGASPKSDCRLSFHRRKKALLCGVTYNKFHFKLDGTVNDVNSMKALLLDHFHFADDSILVLTEEKTDPSLIPTNANMQKALKWLVEGCESGDSLLFYFSGHGLRQPDFSNDERDGFDETLCPVDFKTAGMILDNDINTTIVKPLKQGVILHAIVDSCHSGTILDLEHVYNRKVNDWVDNKPPSGVDKSTSGGIAISISACADNQMAADSSVFTGNEMSGAMTYSLIQAIKTINKMTYSRLLEFMHEKIKEASKTGCISSQILNKMFCRRIIQDPLLSSSQKFDVTTTEFKL